MITQVSVYCRKRSSQLTEFSRGYQYCSDARSNMTARPVQYDLQPGITHLQLPYRASQLSGYSPSSPALWAPRGSGRIVGLIWAQRYKPITHQSGSHSLSSIMSPNPADLDSFSHQRTKLSTGRTYHYVDQLPASYAAGKTVTLLLVHGFPDLWCVFLSTYLPWPAYFIPATGLPGNTKSAVGLKLAIALLRRTCWVMVRLTSLMNLRNIHSKGSLMISPPCSTTLVPQRPYALPSQLSTT